MEPGKNNLQQIMRWFEKILSCPHCGSHYTSDCLQLIRGKTESGFADENFVIHSECPRCRGFMIFHVGLNPAEFISFGMMSDLTAADAGKFRLKQPLTPDEILELHAHLAGCQGDLHRALPGSSA